MREAIPSQNLTLGLPEFPPAVLSPLLTHESNGKPQRGKRRRKDSSAPPMEPELRQLLPELGAVDLTAVGGQLATSPRPLAAILESGTPALQMKTRGRSSIPGKQVKSRAASTGAKGSSTAASKDVSTKPAKPRKKRAREHGVVDSAIQGVGGSAGTLAPTRAAQQLCDLSHSPSVSHPLSAEAVLRGNQRLLDAQKALAPGLVWAAGCVPGQGALRSAAAAFAASGAV